MLTARADGFIAGNRDIEDIIKRLQAFEKAGADVLYAPGLPNIDAITEVCQSVSAPVNVVMGLTGTSYTVAELKEAGVKRISTGGSLARAGMGAVLRAAKEIKEQGSFNYASLAVSDADAQKMMHKNRDSAD